MGNDQDVTSASTLPQPPLSKPVTNGLDDDGPKEEAEAATAAITNNENTNDDTQTNVSSQASSHGEQSVVQEKEAVKEGAK